MFTFCNSEMENINLKSFQLYSFTSLNNGRQYYVLVLLQSFVDFTQIYTELTVIFKGDVLGGEFERCLLVHLFYS